MCSLLTNIVPTLLNDHRFSFDALSYFTQNEYSGLALKTLSIFLSKSKEYITNFSNGRFAMNNTQDNLEALLRAERRIELWFNTYLSVTPQ